MIWLLFLSLPVCRPSSSLTGGGGVEEEPNYTTTRKPVPPTAINHSILFAEILHFSGGGDEMVQICRSFRYNSAKKKPKKLILWGYLLYKNYYYCRGSGQIITSTGSTVCTCISSWISKVHSFNTCTLLYILFIYQH